MFTDQAQYTSKNGVTCSWHAKPYKFEPPKAISDSCRTFSSGNKSEPSFLDKRYQHNTYDSSMASMETDNLREGLKITVNPIFEVKIGKSKSFKPIFYYAFMIIVYKQILYLNNQPGIDR